VAKMRWLKKVPIVRSASPRRLTVSLAESLMFRGAIKPITFGGKLYLSYLFVRWTKDVAAERRARLGIGGAERVEGRKRAGAGPACLTLAMPRQSALCVSRR